MHASEFCALMREMHNTCSDSKQYRPKRYLGRKSYVKLCKIQSRSAFDWILLEMLSGRSHIHQAMQNCKVAGSAFFPATDHQQLYCSNHRLQYPARQRCMDCALRASMILPLKSSSRLHPAYRGFNRRFRTTRRISTRTCRTTWCTGRRDGDSGPESTTE